MLRGEAETRRREDAERRVSEGPKGRRGKWETRRGGGAETPGRADLRNVERRFTPGPIRSLSSPRLPFAPSLPHPLFFVGMICIAASFTSARNRLSTEPRSTMSQRERADWPKMT